jgi:hypothetical protein
MSNQMNMKITTLRGVTLLIEGDYIVRIIKTGFTKPQRYHVIIETPYDYVSDASMKTMDEICKTYNVTAKELTAKFDE